MFGVLVCGNRYAIHQVFSAGSQDVSNPNPDRDVQTADVCKIFWIRGLTVDDVDPWCTNSCRCRLMQILYLGALFKITINYDYFECTYANYQPCILVMIPIKSSTTVGKK